MKTLVEDYSFDKTRGTITFPGKLRPHTLEEILLITNVTGGTILYNFADKLRGGTLSENVLTLVCDTSKMADSDRLQIFIDTDIYHDDVLFALAGLLRSTNYARDAADRMRTIVDNSVSSLVYTRNSSSGLSGSTEPWYSSGAWSTVDAREQLMSIQQQAIMLTMQKWVRG